jgi:hypothetical protein
VVFNLARAGFNFNDGELQGLPSTVIDLPQTRSFCCAAAACALAMLSFSDQID